MTISSYFITCTVVPKHVPLHEKYSILNNDKKELYLECLRVRFFFFFVCLSVCLPVLCCLSTCLSCVVFLLVIPLQSNKSVTLTFTILQADSITKIPRCTSFAEVTISLIKTVNASPCDVITSIRVCYIDVIIALTGLTSFTCK